MAGMSYDEVDAAVFRIDSSEMPVCVMTQNQYYHPSYHTLLDRIQSFPEHWPYNGLRSPQEMAKAGLFYGNSSENEDEVWCFCCGAKLWNWEPNDIPLHEHVKIAKKQCAFLNNAFGEAKVDELILDYLKSIDQKGKDESMKNMREKGYKAKELLNAISHIKRSGGPNEKTVDEAVEIAKKGREGFVNQCTNCKQEELEIMFLPCHHTVSCTRCSDETGNCFVCNKDIKDRMRVYMS